MQVYDKVNKTELTADTDELIKLMEMEVLFLAGAVLEVEKPEILV